MKLSKPTLRIATMATLLVVTAGAATYTYWYKPQPYANQDEILAKIAQANEGTKRDASTSVALTGESDQKISALYLRPPEDRDYNYRKYTNSYEIGSAANKCATMVPYQSNVTKDELYEYFSDSKEMFPKYVKSVVYAGNDLFDYNLTIGSDRWQYRGGNYAVHLTNVQQIMPLAALSENVKATEVDEKPVAEMPVTQTVEPSKVADPREVIKNYFGEGATIVGTKTYDGREVYEAKWTFSATCSDLQTNPDRSISSSSAELDEKITVVALADAKDFAIVSESYYLGNVSGRNLLYTHEMKEEKKMIANYSEVQDQFTFSINVPVRKVDASAFKYDAEYRKAVLEYANKNLTSVAYLAGKLKLQSLSSPYVTIIPDHEKHLIDREFYSRSSFGQTLYDENKDMFKPYLENGKTYPALVLAYEGTGPMTWSSLALVKGTVIAKDAIATLGVDSANIKEKGLISLTVDGKSTEATVYEIEQKNSVVPEPGNSGSSDTTVSTLPAPEGIESEYKEYYVVFSTSDITGVVQTNVSAKTALTELAKLLQVKTVNANDISLLDKTLPVPVVTGNPELIAL